MNKKTPSLLISFAIVWSTVGQPVAALAQGGPRSAPSIRLAVGGVKAVAPSLSAPSIQGLGGVPSVAGLANLEAGVPSLPPALEAAAPAVAQAGAAQAVSQPAAAAPGGPGGEGPRRGPSAFRALADAVVKRLSGRTTFDGHRGAAPVGMAGFLPLPKPNLPQGVDLDNAPISPDPKTVSGVDVNTVNIPGAKTTTDDIFAAGPRLLQADPTSEADVERALRELIDQDAATYGVAAAELATVHVRRVEGVGDQADTIYAVFRQQAQGTNPDGSPNRIAIHGTSLSLTVKVVNGKPLLMSAMAKLYPTLVVDARQRLSDDELKAQAIARIGLPANSGVELQFVERKVIYAKSAWHAANLYMIDGLPFMIAIDIATGEAFAWDGRLGATYSAPASDAPTPISPAAPAASASGEFKGRVETSDKRPNRQPILTEQPLAFLNVKLEDGTVVETDENGQIDVKIDKPMKATAVLSGRYVVVNDKALRPVTINVTLQPGQKTTVLVNETDNDETARSQANVYVAVTHVRVWVGKRGINDKRIDQQIPAYVNIDDECNAYYTPGRPSLNFFKSSKNCSDTSKPGVVKHEWGHHLDHMIGGITNGGLSEGWGDILSMYILNSPIIGEGFLLGRTPDYIRNGENDYQYGKFDEVHDQGQAWMGFAWKLREALIASLGAAAGAAAAESLVLPTLYAKASDIPAAISQVLLNSMNKSGQIQHEKEIRGAAKAHGIDLPKSPSLASSALSLLASPMRGVSGVTSQFETLAAGGQTGGRLLAAGEASAEKPYVRAKVELTAGRLVASQIRRQIEKYCEFHDLKYDLKSFGGVFTVDFVLTVEGPEDKVRFLISELERLSNQ